MSKEKLEYETPENVIVKYKEQDIGIKPILDFPTQVFLISEYINDYFGHSDDLLFDNMEYHPLEAECKLMYFVYKLNTTLSNIDDIASDLYGDEELWEIVTDNIKNWWQFYQRLLGVLDETKKQKEREISLGVVLSDLINKLESFVNQIADISPEDIEKIQKTGEELMERLENSSVLKNPNDLAQIQESVLEEEKLKEE